MDTGNVFPPPQRLTPERQDRILSVLLDEMSAPLAPARPPRTGRRWQLRAAAVAAATAATVAAVMLTITIPSGRPGARPPAHHPAAALPTGRQILLAAATSVAHQQPGKYWHIMILETQTNVPANVPGGNAPDTIDQWVARDGNSWSSPPCKAGASVKVVMKNGDVSFGIGNPRKTIPSWTYDMVRHWPTSPTALEARIASYSTNKTLVLQALIALELVVPSPPGVRAAAYQAIATFPGVQDRGAVKGGHAVFIPAQDGGPLLLALDPATGLIHSQTWLEPSGPQTSWNVLLAQWTNHLPKVVPLNKYYRCGSG